MSIKVAQNWFILKYFDTLTKIAKNVVDLGKMFIATGIEKLPNLVTLISDAAQEANTAICYLHLIYTFGSISIASSDWYNSN